MADITTFALATATTPDNTEFMNGWQASAAKKFPMNFLKGLRANPSTISAAGSNNQSTATLLDMAYEWRLVGTVGANAGVRFAALAAFTVIQFQLVTCSGLAANPLLVWPVSGGKFNDQSVNQPMTVPIGITGLFFCVSTTDWRTLP